MFSTQKKALECQSKKKVIFQTRPNTKQTLLVLGDISKSRSIDITFDH